MPSKFPTLVVTCRIVFAFFALAFAIQPMTARADELDTRPLPLALDVVFRDVKWPGWDSGEDSGKVNPLRPILLTGAGDGSNRIFVPEQRGTIYVLPNAPSVKEAQVFLDIQAKVAYDDKTNEEGLLGLAFHPKYKENGRFFVYYTNKNKPHQNVVASYRVSKDNPNVADAASEEILLVLNKPFWNHDGGTICFGPDGMLYIALGDGGAANDPLANGQKLSTLLGKILRIDIDKKEGKLAYAIPADNPFVGKGDARGEIWAYGLRNVWRMAFDRQTGVLWAADVGQDIWEEIDLIVKGGNYGWSIREGQHPFGKKGVEARADLIEPIWEYKHDIGKSITGGLVYRGKKIPELNGAYLYADYVSGKLWALWYDAEQKKVTANREVPTPKTIAVMSFGEDEQGEVYILTYSAGGDAIYKLGPAASK
jgi:glucose/arabinose dehydrogenase